MVARNARTESREWLWIALLWSAFALFDATKTVGVMRSEGMHHNWPVLFLIETFSWLPWAGATVLIFWLARRVPLLGRPGTGWLAHVGACIGVGLVFSAWTTLLVLVFQPFGPPDPPGFLRHWFTNFYDGLPGTVVFYVCILMIRNVLDSRERAAKQQTELAQLNEQLAHAHLAALRRQIEPHFLFNALNAVSGLVREGRGESAVDMIAALSDFLRRSLAGSGRQEVHLRDEMDFVERYLAIQQARFADRLNVDVDVPQQLLDACVPNLILQPLVENAIKHGISKLRNGGAIQISAAAVRNVLVLNVSNDGPVVGAPSDNRQGGIGVSNVRSRLRGLYGDASAFEMRDRLGGGMEVSISMPLHFAASAAEATVEHKPA